MIYMSLIYFLSPGGDIRQMDRWTFKTPENLIVITDL